MTVPPAARKTTWRSYQKLTAGMDVIHIPTGGVYKVRRAAKGKILWCIEHGGKGFNADVEDLLASDLAVRQNAWLDWMFGGKE